MTDRPANATAASLLGLLHDGPRSGWDLVAAAQQVLGNFWTLTSSQVYRELARLADQGLVESGPPGPRDRRPYALTTPGRAAFAAWLEDEPGRETIRVPLLLTVALGRHVPPERLVAVLDAARARHTARLEAYREQHDAAREAGADPYALATLAFGIGHEAAVVAWFDSPEVRVLRDTVSP